MSTDYGSFEWPPSGGGVLSFNGLVGAINLLAGTNITLGTVGNNITINSTASGSVTAVTATPPLASSGGTTPNITISQSTTSTNGYLSSTDWNTFNGKQASGSYITALTGDVTATGPGSSAATIAALAVTNAKIANATIDLTTKVTGMLPAANGGSPPVTRNLWVDKNRTDSFTADGSLGRPFATITAAINQIITNADNSTHQYTIFVAPGAYSETLTFNSALLFSVVITCWMSTIETPQNCSVTGLTSTSNNTQLATLVFNNITFNGSVNLTGDITNTNFASVQVLFSACQFNNSSGTIVLNNINNVNFYNCQVQGTGSVSTFTNVAFGYIEGAEGYISNTTLHLVDNPGGNIPSQYSGNYLLLSTAKIGATVTIDAGSELDTIQSYFSSASNITNNGTIHSFQSTWSGASTLNSGSTTRLRGDTINTNPTLNGGAVTTNQSTIYLGTIAVGSSATPATNAVIVAKDGHLKSTQTTAPTAAPNANAGTGATCTVSNATDTSGILNLTTTAVSPAAGAQGAVTFNKAYNVAPRVTLTPANANAAQLAVSSGVYVSSTTTTLTVNFAVADAVGHAYIWNYHIMETQ